MRKLLLGLALAMALPAFAAEHWIDVRVPQQYQKEHVDGAVNIPLADLKTRIAAEVPDKNHSRLLQRWPAIWPGSADAERNGLHAGGECRRPQSNSDAEKRQPLTVSPAAAGLLHFID